VTDATGTSNSDLTLEMFPFHKLVNPESRGTGGVNPNDPAVIQSLDDRTGAQGVIKTRFLGTREGQPTEPGRVIRQTSTDQSKGHNVRQITGRNAPTVINAVFNFANFWDGRANHYFNANNPFGVQDINARVWVNQSNSLSQLDLSLPANLLNNSSLASQAVGPPMSDVEMSWLGRTWPDVGRKILSLKPLATQKVHASDSVLAGLAEPVGKGLKTTYAALIQAAFQPEFWNSAARINGYSQMEANFALFFGLSVQLYEATLVSDDTPFDRFQNGNPAAMSASAQRGMNTFFSTAANCSFCHTGAEFTTATVSIANNPEEPGVIETMNMGDGGIATYDIGFYNIGLIPTAQDIGRGANDPFGNPLSFSRQRQIINGNGTADTTDGKLTFNSSFVPNQGCIPDLLANVPLICPPVLSTVTRIAVNGNFKTPTLRNVELTGPYMHNGSMATLGQVVDFYVRGGNFREANLSDLDPFINDIPSMKGTAGAPLQVELIDFLKSLTDERVRWEEAPFDHPQIFVPDGHQSLLTKNPKLAKSLTDRMLEIPAVGRNGRLAEGLGPLKPYLADDLSGADLDNFHYLP
jgi:cytochrome c peroxidase